MLYHYAVIRPGSMWMASMQHNSSKAVSRGFFLLLHDKYGDVFVPHEDVFNLLHLCD